MLDQRIMKELNFQFQRLGMILLPLLTAGVCLLAGLELGSTTVITVVVAFFAALYSRRLYAYADDTVLRGQQTSLAALLQDMTNVVVYGTRDKRLAIGFYKIVTRPQSELLATLHATVANSQLTLSLLDNDEGSFLAIRFSGKDYRDEARFLWDAQEHIETLIQTIAQDVPGLEPISASAEEVQRLTGILGLTVTGTKGGPTASGLDQDVAGSTLENHDAQNGRGSDDDITDASIETAGRLAEVGPLEDSLETASEQTEAASPMNPSAPEGHEDRGGAELLDEAWSGMPHDAQPPHPALEQTTSNEEQAGSSSGRSTSKATAQQPKGPTLDRYLAEEAGQPQRSSSTASASQNAKSHLSKTADANIAATGEAQPKIAVVDGSNVAWDAKTPDGKPKVANIGLMREALANRGYEAIVFVSASLRHKIDRPDELEAMINRSEVKQTPAGTYDDAFIIETARQFDAAIVSNDQFRDFDKEPWLAERRLRYSIVREDVIFYAWDAKKGETSEDKARETAKDPSKRIGQSKSSVAKPAEQSPQNMQPNVARLKELQEQIPKVMAMASEDPQARPLTAIGKRILGRGLVKDMASVLEIVDQFPGLAEDVKKDMKDSQEQVEELLEIASDETLDPEELWERIPGAVERIEALLEIMDRTSEASQPQVRKKKETAQTA
ncbi:MAG: hypothetical protein ACE5OZ_01295 [Candidatus Heimdallarchaeota archaeon]